MILQISIYMRRICYAIFLTIFVISLCAISMAAEGPSCEESVEAHRANWISLPSHDVMQSRECHSRLSDSLKAKAGTNDMLSHAVYHQILAGESFRKIPLWPDKHKDWIGAYDGFDYTAVFWPALEAAERSWDEGFEGGVKHDFAIGWTKTITETDFGINEYRNRTGGMTGLGHYLVLPVIFFTILALIEALFVRLGLFSGLRMFYRNKSR